MADRVALSLASNASNAVRTDRVFGTAYQPSTTKPSRVTANLKISVPLGFMASVWVTVGDSTGTMIEQGRRELQTTGNVTVVGTLVGITLGLVFVISDTIPLTVDVPPGGYYMVNQTKSGTATTTLVSVKERVF